MPSFNSTAAHTAGPWIVDDGCTVYGKALPDMMDYRVGIEMPAPFTENEHGDFERVETQRGAIALGRTPEEARANARLIAAAPELLEAVQELLATHPAAYRDAGSIDNRTDNAVKIAHAAIAAAKGGAR